MVREVLLGLVEDQVDVTRGLRALDRFDQLVGLDPAQLGDGRGEGRGGVFPQLEKTTTTGASGSSRSARATAAKRSDDLPTPLGPYRTVSRDAMRFATTISVSRSRPKK